MARGPSAAELLGAGIEALAHADGEQLEALVEAARGIERPRTPRERELAQERLRTLGMLLELTQRNLRLLRGAAGYGLLRE